VNPIKRLRKGAVRNELIFLLFILSIIYIAGDLVTTGWLIFNDPSGILNETNPIGRYLYIKGGLQALVIGKLVAFVPLIILSLIFDSKYRDVVWFREVIETSLLGLLTYSMIIILNNLFAIYVIAFTNNQMNLVSFLPVLRGLSFFISVTFSALILRVLGVQDYLKMFEVYFGTIVLAGPLTLYSPLLNVLKGNVWLFLSYIMSVLTFLGIFFYLIEESRKNRVVDENLK
jgi:hypothetical protein